MQKMDCQAIGYGYIIIPKALLKEQAISDGLTIHFLHMIFCFLNFVQK